MSKSSSPNAQAAHTKRSITELLKRQGPQDAKSLAGQLDISAMAVRQHLYQMQTEKLVTFEQEARPMGRPAKLWKLTSEADVCFPDAHAELAVGLISAMNQAFGSNGLEQLLRVRSQKQIETYKRRIPDRGSLRRRLMALAKIRTEEGYMAEVLTDESGQLCLVENHCPICSAATACIGLCSVELDVFQAVLGKHVAIDRTEHIISGARRCAYKVRNRRSQ